MGKVKALMMEAEETLDWCLTEKGMTNMQALEYINDKHGGMAMNHCEWKLKHFIESDKSPTKEQIKVSLRVPEITQKYDNLGRVIKRNNYSKLTNK